MPAPPSLRSSEPAQDAAAGALTLALLREAVADGARSLHLQPTADGGLTVRVRAPDGLRPGPCPQVPAELAPQVLRRLKARAGLDLGEAVRPQEGHLTLQRPAPGRPVVLRVSTLPTSLGEAVVVTVTGDLAAPTRLAALGLDPSDLARVVGALTAPGGLVLAVGPAGSGKGTFLRAALRHVAQDPDRITYSLDAESGPDLPGTITLRLSPEVNVNVDTMLRAILGAADADVVHVPDLMGASCLALAETARHLADPPGGFVFSRLTTPSTAMVAAEAAAMGRLVLAGLAVDDAPSAVLRLLDAGVPGYLVAASLQTIVSCRTVRRLCDACKLPAPALDADDQRRLAPRLVEEELLSGWERSFSARPGGCDACAGVGLAGRIGLYEVVERPAPLIDAVVRGAGAPAREAVDHAALAASLHGRTRTLREAALLRAAAGLVSLVEALRSTPPAPGGAPPRSC